MMLYLHNLFVNLHNIVKFHELKSMGMYSRVYQNHYIKMQIKIIKENKENII